MYLYCTCTADSVVQYTTRFPLLVQAYIIANLFDWSVGCKATQLQEIEDNHKNLKILVSERTLNWNVCAIESDPLGTPQHSAPSHKILSTPITSVSMIQVVSCRDLSCFEYLLQGTFTCRSYRLIRSTCKSA